MDLYMNLNGILVEDGGRFTSSVRGGVPRNFGGNGGFSSASTHRSRRSDRGRCMGDGGVCARGYAQDGGCSMARKRKRRIHGVPDPSTRQVLPQHESSDFLRP
jgi:hypothetical protein